MNKTVLNTAVSAAGPVTASEVVPGRGVFDLLQDVKYKQLFGVNGAVRVNGVEIDDAGYVGRPTATRVRIVLWNKTKRMKNGLRTYTVNGKQFRFSTIRVKENGW